MWKIIKIPFTDLAIANPRFADVKYNKKLEKQRSERKLMWDSIFKPVPKHMYLIKLSEKDKYWVEKYTEEGEWIKFDFTSKEGKTLHHQIKKDAVEQIIEDKSI